MSDPLSAIYSISAAYVSIKENVVAVRINRERYNLLISRCDAVMKPIDLLKANPSSMIGKAEMLFRVDECFKEIESFVQSSRFRKNRFLDRLNEYYMAKDDSRTFNDLNAKLNVVWSDLGIMVAINHQLESAAYQNDVKETHKQILMLLDVLGKSVVTNEKTALKIAIENAEKIEKITVDDFDEVSTLSLATKDNSTAPLLGVSNELEVQLTPVNNSLLVWDSRKNRKIGQGSSGSVYSAKYNNNKVAVKSIDNVVQRVDGKLLKAIKKEALIMQYADHPNIIGFYAASLDRGLIVTELANCSLQDVIHSSHPIVESSNITLNPTRMSLNWKLNVVVDIAKALRYIHAHNIIHRDIKPANILLVVESGRTIAKLSDFGLSQAVNIAASTIRATAHKKAVGTVCYMAPELYASSPPPYSPMSDMFAFGVLVAALMTGERPFAGLPEHVITHRIVNDKERPSLSKWVLSGDIREQKLRRFVEACFNHDPSVRATADEICEKLSTIEVRLLSSPDNSLKELPLVPRVASPSVVDREKDKNIQNLVNWMATYLPNIPVTRRRHYAEIMHNKDLTTIDRVKYSFEKDKHLFESLNFSPFDCFEATQLLGHNVSSDPSPQGASALIEWFKSAIPDMKPVFHARYAELLIANDVHNVVRLRSVLKRKQLDLVQIGFHKFDNDDILNSTSDSVASTPQGYDVILSFIRTYASGIVASKAEIYARILFDENVATVRRLRTVILRKKSDSWLFNKLGNEMDVRDIVKGVAALEKEENDINADLVQKAEYNRIKKMILSEWRLKDKGTYVSSFGPSIFEYQDEYGWTLSHWASWAHPMESLLYANWMFSYGSTYCYYSART